MLVLWNLSGDKYAIMFDKTINIYNVSVSRFDLVLFHQMLTFT